MMTYVKKGYHTIISKLERSTPLRYILFGFGLALIPLMSEINLLDFSTVSVYALIIVYTIVALGLNLLLGFSGLISLASAGFVGFGAYGLVFFSNTLGVGFFLAAIVTMIIAALIGGFIGLFSLKVEGIYLAIATLFVGEILLQIFKQVNWFSGGFSGQRFHYPEFKLGFMTIELNRNFTFIFLVLVLLLVMIALYNIVHSRTGRALMAISRSEHAAQAMGISILKYRLIAFIAATIIATIAGIMYVSFFRSVEPTGWNLNLSLLIIAMVVVGGFKSIFGTFLGAFVIHGIPTFFLKELFSSGSGISYVFSGIMIIGFIMFYPNGVTHIYYDIKRLIRHIKERRKKVAVDE